MTNPAKTNITWLFQWGLCRERTRERRPTREDDGSAQQTGCQGTDRSGPGDAAAAATEASVFTREISAPPIYILQTEARKHTDSTRAPYNTALKHDSH